MPTIHLRIEPVFCGPMSVGTVEVIKLLRDRLGISLAEAKDYFDRCVFSGETVALSFETVEAATAFAIDAVGSSSTAKISVGFDSNSGEE